MRYSLADHVVTITLPESVATNAGISGNISIGGEGSYMGSITVSRPTALYTTEGDSTGSWVHSKNLNKTGTVSIELNQLAPQIETLKNLFKIYEKSSTITEGMTLTITEGDETVAVCNDCYVDKMPDQVFGDTASKQNWTLTCGQVTYN